MKMLLLLFCFLSLSSFANGATTYDVSGKITFEADVDKPTLDFTGVTESLKGTIIEADDGSITGELTVAVKEVDTTGGLPFYKARDGHMHEHMQADKFPTVTLKLTEVKDGKFKGDLTMVGVTKPVEGTATRGEDKLSYAAAFTIDITNWGLEEPSKMSATVNKILPFKVEAKLVAK